MEILKKYRQIVKELLTDHASNLTIAATTVSEASFAKIWDNPEDAEYDNLGES